jgi:hypothetical protein
MRAGVNVLALAGMLGHKDPSMTLRVYADLFDTDLDPVAESLHAKYSPEDELQKLARATGKILHHYLMTVRERGGVFQIGDAALNDESLAATVAVQKLKARVLDDDLRARVGDFVNLCGYASTGAVIAHKNDPPDVIEAVINNVTADMGMHYDDLTERLGAHIRSELGRS